MVVYAMGFMSVFGQQGLAISQEPCRASQNPIRPIRRTRAADFGPSLSMFKKAADIEVSYKTMYVCTAAENFFVTSWSHGGLSSVHLASLTHGERLLGHYNALLTKHTTDNKMAKFCVLNSLWLADVYMLLCRRVCELLSPFSGIGSDNGLLHELCQATN